MEEIKPGDHVSIKGQEATGQVISVKGNNVEVALGLMKITVKKDRLTVVEPEEESEEDQPEYGGSLIDTKEKLMNFPFQLDLRGKMKDEVITELEAWVDNAILLGIKEASVLHGRGTGVVKDTVRSALKKYKEVEKLEDAPREKGGENVTVVKFGSRQEAADVEKIP